MAKARPVLPVDDESSEETLSENATLAALLQPRPGSFIRGQGSREIGLGAERVPCGALVSDAVIEDRG